MLEHAVPFLMAERVVDRLEVVEVEHDDREAAAMAPLGVATSGAQARLEVAAVEEARQSVDRGVLLRELELAAERPAPARARATSARTLATSTGPEKGLAR